MIDEIRFWQQVLTDSERTVICNPDLESRCKGYVAARGLEGVITVEASPACPVDQIFVFDHNALEANLRQVLARPIGLR